jgi:purine-binding chemotaxis protein CheW
VFSLNVIIKFGIKPSKYTNDTRVLVVRVDIDNTEVIIGALVDSVLEVFEMDTNMIKSSPAIGARYQKDYIKGMITKGDSFQMLLDIDKVFQIPA